MVRLGYFGARNGCESGERMVGKKDVEHEIRDWKKRALILVYWSDGCLLGLQSGIPKKTFSGKFGSLRSGCEREKWIGLWLNLSFPDCPLPQKHCDAWAHIGVTCETATFAVFISKLGFRTRAGLEHRSPSIIRNKKKIKPLQISEIFSILG